MILFRDRHDAGRQLAQRLESMRDEDPVIIGLPRGGVPVAAEVAAALKAPLDVIIVRKLGVPDQPEVAMGAIGEGEFLVVDRKVLNAAQVSESAFLAVMTHEKEELARRVAILRQGRARVNLLERTAVIVDDGVATGSTARVACRVARSLGAKRVVLATPVAPLSVARSIEEADEVIALFTPEPFAAVGLHYADFSPTSEDEVIAALNQAPNVAPTPEAGGATLGVDHEIVVPAGHVDLIGHLQMPEDSTRMVVFAHGAGSSRLSPRNRSVASTLNNAGISTLLLDLLTREEEGLRAPVFDIDLLARRLVAVTQWLTDQPAFASMHVGYFGASTGAGAALQAAARLDGRIEAVVSRGGRPDLAGDALPSVTAPTLLIVGGADDEVLKLNEYARARMNAPNELVVVPGATHLFEEPGALEAVALLARDWFLSHLGLSLTSTGRGGDR